jgi:hypothetical protein
MKKIRLILLATTVAFLMNSCKKDEGTSTSTTGPSPITFIGTTINGPAYYYDYKVETNSQNQDFRDIDVSITDVTVLENDSMTGGSYWLELDLNSANLGRGVLNTEKFTYTKNKDAQGDYEREPSNIVYVGLTTNITYDSEGDIDEDLSSYIEMTATDEFVVDITNNGDGTHNIKVDGTIDGKVITGTYVGKVKNTN